MVTYDLTVIAHFYAEKAYLYHCWISLHYSIYSNNRLRRRRPVVPTFRQCLVVQNRTLMEQSLILMEQS